MQHEKFATAKRAKKRVLVVDDQDQVREVLKLGLEAMGSAVEVACNGQEALSLLRTGDYDAVVCDLMMPVMGGDEVFRICERQRPEVARRFVFLSGFLGGAAAAAFIRSTGQPYLAKPCHLADVQAAIAHVTTPRACFWGGVPA